MVTDRVPLLARQLRLPSSVFVIRPIEDIPVKPSGKYDYKALEVLG